MTKLRSNVTIVLAVAAGLTLLGEAFTRWFGISTYLMPRPLEVWRMFFAHADVILPNAATTFSEAAAGFAGGTAAALLVAVVFAWSAGVRRIFFPLAIALQTVPLIVTTPILVLIFGNGLTPKIMVSGLVCFFPTVVHMTKGLTRVDPALFDVFRMLRASEAAILWKLRFPSSLPDLFSTLKLASANCVIGSILGEWISADRGIGYLLAVYLYQLDVARLYAAVIAGSAVALILLAAVVAVERMVVHWKTA